MQKDKLPAKNLPVACAVEIIIGFAMEHAGDIIRRISPFAEAFDPVSYTHLTLPTILLV